MKATRESYSTAGTVEHGKLKMQDRAAFERAIAEFADGLIIATFDAATAADIRSIQANKLQWVVFSIIAEASGHTKDEIHDLMCAMFLSYETEVVNPQTGESETRMVSRGTSRLKPKEHSEFLDRVMAWAGDFFGCEFGDVERAS